MVTLSPPILSQITELEVPHRTSYFLHNRMRKQAPYGSNWDPLSLGALKVRQSYGIRLALRLRREQDSVIRKINKVRPPSIPSLCTVEWYRENNAS
eukprot:7411345-Pyramimonas_sp.AAC.1